jgi:hypothetical protein
MVVPAACLILFLAVDFPSNLFGKKPKAGNLLIHCGLFFPSSGTHGPGDFTLVLSSAEWEMNDAGKMKVLLLPLLWVGRYFFASLVGAAFYSTPYLSCSCFH